MSYELRKTMITALSLVVLGGIFNSFGSHQRIHVTMPRYANAWQVYTVPSQSFGDSTFHVTKSSAQFDSLTKVAVVLVNFDDEKIKTTPEQWQDLVFGKSNSVYNYYNEVSQGQLAVVPSPESSGIANDGIIEVRLATPHPNNGNTLTDKAYDAVFDAIKAAAPSLPLESLDKNQDRKIQSTELVWVVVFAGYEDLYKRSGGKSSSGFSHEISRLGKIEDYVMTEFIQIGELYYDQYVSKKDSITTQGILTHEFGHILGLPDLYDTDYSSQGAGIFSLMANGDKLFKPRGRMGDTPTDLDPWSKIYLGFVDVKLVDKSGTHTINSNKWNKPEILMVPTANEGEYFLIENRLLQNRDTGLDLFAEPGGILIWHIQEKVIFSNMYENIVNNDETAKGVDLEESSETTLGLSQLDGTFNDKSYMPFFTKEKVSLFNETSKPNSLLSDGKASGISVEILSDGFTAKVKIDIQK